MAERRRRPVRWLNRFVVAACRYIPTITAGGGLVLLAALQVPWLEGAVEKVGISGSGAAWSGIVVVALVGISGQIHEISSKIESTGSESRRFLRDNIDLYPFVVEHLEKVERPEHRRVDVLGSHLAGILPIVSVLVRRPEMSGWTIRISAMTGLREGAHYLVDEAWRAEAAKNVALARRLADSPDIGGRKVTLEIYEYDFPPFLYGARFGNGDLVICFLRWMPDGRLNKSSAGYEFIPGTEQTPGADSMRHLFDSWFRRSMMESSALSTV